MRNDSEQFAAFNEAEARKPRFVIVIEYPVTSPPSDPTFTSHPGMTNVTGSVVQDVISKISGVSQALHPEDGRTTIGALSFDLVDVAGGVTAEIEGKLSIGEGIRDRIVKIYKGYSDDFSAAEWRLLHTLQLANVDYNDGVYRIQTEDITRGLRTTIFEQKKTNLEVSITAAQTTIPVLDTTGFDTLFHPNSFTDAPGSAVGYLKLTSGEICRYTGISASPAEFTGVTRGVFNTDAAPITVNPSTDPERRPKVEEFIYLELPGPLMAYALMTGELLGTSPVETLPAHWHAGMATQFVRLSDYENIGEDLYDTADVTAGMVLRFTHLKKADTKRFIEREIHLLMGTFAPFYASGEIGLKRMNRVLADAAFDVELDQGNMVRRSALRHDQRAVINQIRIDWNWTGEEFTRRQLVQDNNSIAIHGEATLKELKFKGLHGARHTATTLIELTNTLRDRYSGPPQMLDVTILGSLDRVEVGDIAFVNDSNIRDYANSPPTAMARAFEVQQVQPDYVTGDVRLKLFASSQEADISSSTTPDPALPDTWYDDAGTDLDSLAQVSGGTVNSNITLTGGTDIRASGSIWYHLGNLTIPVGVTVNIEENVQLRIRGTLTVNGTINGIGDGITGTADPSVISPASWSTNPAAPGYIGRTSSWPGVQRGVDATGLIWDHWSGIAVKNRFNTFPNIVLQVNSTGSPAVTTLDGLPRNLRGGGGSHGGAIVDNRAGPIEPLGLGSTGGDGGAGLAIICRGMGLGVSATIDVSGSAGATPGQITAFGVDFFPGAGAGGGAGACLILLDGSQLTVPDLTGVFVSANGASNEQGTPARRFGAHLEWDGPEPLRGLRPGNVNGLDQSNNALRIQFIPSETAAAEDQDAIQEPPTNLIVFSQTLGNLISWTNPASFDLIEIHASADNVRSNAVKVGETKANVFLHELTPGLRRYYWIRAKDEQGSFSDWENGGASPVTTTTGVATAGAEGIINDPYFSAPLDEEWESKPPDPSASPLGDNGGISLISGGGNLGANSLRMDVPDLGAAGPFFGPIRKFAITPGEVITCQFRMRLDASITSMFFVLRMFDQDGNFIQTTGGGGLNIWNWINDGPGLNVWATGELQIDTTVSPTSPPQFGADNNALGELVIDASDSSSQSPEANADFDFIQLFRAPKVFGGEGGRLAGLVPAPGAETGLFLKDNGTWADPTVGGGTPLPTGAAHDGVYFSDVPSPDLWQLTQNVTTSDYVRFGSATGLNVRLYSNTVEARSGAGQVPATLNLNDDGGQVLLGSGTGFAIRFDMSAAGYLQFENALGEIRWAGTPKILFNSAQDRVRIASDLEVNDQAGGNNAIIVGENTTPRAAAQDGIVAIWGEQASTLREYRITNFGDIVRHALQTGLGVEWQGDGDWLFDLRDGAKVRVRDAIDGDWGEQWHDGASYIFDFFQTLNLLFRDITDIQIIDTTTSPDTIKTVLTDADVKRSIEVDASDLQLVGDVAAPGNNQVYGTSGAGARVWKADPGQSVKRSIEIDAGSSQLVGDVDTPGNNQVYGTSGAGARGWKADPTPTGRTITTDAANTSIDNTTTLTNFLSHTFGAGSLGNGDIAIARMGGWVLNNSGSADSVIWRVTLDDGTEVTMFEETFSLTAPSGGGLRRPWEMEVIVAVRTQASLCNVFVNWGMQSSGFTQQATTGKGGWSNITAAINLWPHQHSSANPSVATIDFSSAVTLRCKFQWGTANANQQFDKDYSWIDVP